MEHGSARTLLGGVVDYAGLFPPAALDMAAAVGAYAEARAGADAWMLGRFVLPAARLGEFAAARAGLPSGSEAWLVSAIVRDRSPEDAEAVMRFNRDAAGDVARVDSIECRPETIDGIDWLAATFGEPFEVYAEIAPGPEAPAWLSRVAARRLRAKVRTGGVTAEAFPPPDALLAWLDAAVGAGVAFKATAGLHHAVRGPYRLTYEPGSPSAPMYGYLNVLLATAALADGRSREVARHLLTRDAATALDIGMEGVRWDDVTLSTAALARARAAHLVSFGSCSFGEPSGEYRALASRA